MNATRLPLLLFALLFALLGLGLLYARHHDISEVPSSLVGKQAPAYALPELYAPEKTFGNDRLAGKPYLLHVFASWCFVCRDENPMLVAERNTLGIPLVGFDYKDDPEDAKLWLKRYGNPYDVVISDISGKAGIDLGVYGAPESFLIDGRGMIRYKHIGALSAEVLRSEFQPVLQAIKRENGR